MGATATGVDDARLLAGVDPGEIRAAIAEVAQRAAVAAEPSDDRRGSAAYKRAMVATWTERALLACLSA
jgi:CO/xanthine dehydrogenase FAD-binding subunit